MGVRQPFTEPASSPSSSSILGNFLLPMSLFFFTCKMRLTGSTHTLCEGQMRKCLEACKPSAWHTVGAQNVLWGDVKSVGSIYRIPDLGRQEPAVPCPEFSLDAGSPGGQSRAGCSTLLLAHRFLSAGPHLGHACVRQTPGTWGTYSCRGTGLMGGQCPGFRCGPLPWLPRGTVAIHGECQAATWLCASIQESKGYYPG